MFKQNELETKFSELVSNETLNALFKAVIKDCINESVFSSIKDGMDLPIETVQRRVFNCLLNKMLDLVNSNELLIDSVKTKNACTNDGLVRLILEVSGELVKELYNKKELKAKK